jgi:uncharacterized protein with ParB-like and HNH nuclease domain
MKPPTTSDVSLAKLHGYLLARRFAVPKLQRNFVWDPGRAAKLLDSIYRGMPIGSLFLWRTRKRTYFVFARLVSASQLWPLLSLSCRH